MEVIIKPVSSIDNYIKNKFNCFLLPLKDYSVEYENYYTLEEIIDIRKKYSNIKLFISLNKNMFNNDIEPLKNILKKLSELDIEGIFFYDQSIIKLNKDLNLNLKLVWSQTHMVTNYKTINYYNKLGVTYALLSKEITKEEIIEIIKYSKIIPIVEIISKPTMAFSKRKLVSNYYKDLGKEIKNEIDVYEKISDTNIKIKENKDGVFFIKNTITNGILQLDELIDNNLNYILLKEDFIDSKLFIDLAILTKTYIDDYDKIDKQDIINKAINLIGDDTNFFNKKTIYRVK